MPPIQPRNLQTISDVLPRLSASSQHLARRIPAAISSIPLPSIQLRQFADKVLQRRQSSGTAVIPTVYKVDGPAPAAVAGIVLGSVAGFLLLLMLGYFLTKGKGSGLQITGESEEITNRRGVSSPRRRSRRSSRSERINMRERSPRRTTIVEEVRRVPRPSRSSRGSSERIVEERIVEERRSSRPPAPPPIRRVENDDIVEVFEEGSSIVEPAPPRRSGRRRSSGYRSVDPERFAGGDYPRVPVEGRHERG